MVCTMQISTLSQLKSRYNTISTEQEDVQSILQHRYGDLSDIDTDDLKEKMDKGDKMLEDALTNASKDLCIKIFEYEGTSTP